MGGLWSADATYGQLVGSSQPNAEPVHAPNEPEQNVRTIAVNTGMRDNPLLFLVALVAGAVLLLRFSVRGSFEVGG